MDIICSSAVMGVILAMLFYWQGDVSLSRMLKVWLFGTLVALVTLVTEEGTIINGLAAGTYLLLLLVSVFLNFVTTVRSLVQH